MSNVANTLVFTSLLTMLSSPWTSSLCFSESTLLPRGVVTWRDGVGHPLLPLLPWRSSLAWFPKPTRWSWSDRGPPSSTLTVLSIWRPFSDYTAKKMHFLGFPMKTLPSPQSTPVPTSSPCFYADWPEEGDVDCGASLWIHLEKRILCWTSCCCRRYPGFCRYQRHRRLQTCFLHDVELWDT